VSKSLSAVTSRRKLEKSFGAEVWKGNSPPLEAFQPIAQLIERQSRRYG